MDTSARSFHWLVEEACLNAWPSLREMWFGGWLLRVSGGTSRRINSVNPLRDDLADPAEVVQAAEPLYQAFGQDLLIRIPAFLDGLRSIADQAGMVAEGETATLYRDLAGAGSGSRDDVWTAPEADAAWLEARAAIAGSSAEQVIIDRAVLASLMLPRRFAAVRDGEKAVAIAFGAVHRGILVLEAVATHPDHRGRGHARRIVDALTAWGSEVGAEAACLQVLAGNEPARALYRAAGYDRVLYNYQYYRRTRAV